MDRREIDLLTSIVNSCSTSGSNHQIINIFLKESSILGLINGTDLLGSASTLIKTNKFTDQHRPSKILVTARADSCGGIISEIINSTDSTFAFVGTIPSETQITLVDAAGSNKNIMADGESYYIESKTFGPNVGYDNISKKLIIVNDCQNISDSPRFYDLVTGAWTRGWDNAPDKQELL